MWYRATFLSFLMLVLSFNSDLAQQGPAVPATRLTPGTIIPQPNLLATVTVTDTSTAQALNINGSSDTNGANLRLLGTGATTPSKTIRVLSGTMQILNDAYTTAIESLTDAGAVTFTGTGTFSGTGTTGVSTAACFSTAFQLVSDAANCITSLRALKHNIRPLDLHDALNDLDTLMPQSFWWKDHKEPGQRFGFIAEDVEKADPRLATYDGEHHLRAYDPNAMVAELWLIVRNQQKQIAVLNARLTRGRFAR